MNTRDRPQPPTSTYRLQFNRDFTFTDAKAIIPYLQHLGISHVYASPFVQARSGSPHGYDIVDHNALNPEIGTCDDLAAYVDTLHRHGMNQLLDIVPNHMGVGGDDNTWWLDVLENGEASAYASFFDIDWRPVNAALHNKVLLPFLGDHYGRVLEQGELQLSLDADKGAFGVRYYEHLFPIDPRSYPQIIGLRMDPDSRHAALDTRAADALAALIAQCRALPGRTERSATRCQARRKGVTACRQRLASLYRNAKIRSFLDENIAMMNGSAGYAQSFEQLHRLLEAQAYRLAYWQVAADEINYRRFFDINDLAGIRMDNPEVFAATHGLITEMTQQKQLEGLRIDHPDGLSDPYRYCCALQQRTCAAEPGSENDNHRGCYVLVEKILASHERLPRDWPVAGTTGYEVAHLLNGLFVDPDGERPMDRLYSRFTGCSRSFDERLYDCKKLIIRRVLSSELTVLANLASRVAQTNRYTRDYTYHGLREALAEIAACFPVYRTYVTRHRISDADRRHIHWAIERAKKRSPAADLQIFDYLQSLLTLEYIDSYRAVTQRQILQFMLRFQQYTAPVMAKGMEDTAFYAYNRLVSLNDVGFDPDTFGISLQAFHLQNRQRLADWPHSMVTTSTHDSKHGEDVRARINVLSEIPQQWRRHLARWSRLNRNSKSKVNDAPAPSRNDEYLLYQILTGTWPLEPLDEKGLDAFHKRIDTYMRKACREAKTHTSWIRPNPEYEEAMQLFVQALLEKSEHNAFLADFVPFQRSIVRYGLLTSLSQTLLKLTIPGVPDIYQGNECWQFHLVDPDNRRPVDYPRQQRELDGLIEACASSDSQAAFARHLQEHIEDGRSKMYLSWLVLTLRREQADLFSEGEYIELETRGAAAAHICAFLRRHGDREILVLAPRWFARLDDADNERKPDRTEREHPWRQTWVSAPEQALSEGYRNLFSGDIVHAEQRDNGAWLHADRLFEHFPVALLLNPVVQATVADRH